MKQAILTTALLSVSDASFTANADSNYSGHRIGAGISAAGIDTDYGFLVHSSGLTLEYGYDADRVIGFNVQLSGFNNDYEYGYGINLNKEGYLWQISNDIGYAFDFNVWDMKPYGLVGYGYSSETFNLHSQHGSEAYDYNDSGLILGVGLRFNIDNGLYTDIRSELVNIGGLGKIAIGYKF